MGENNKLASKSDVAEMLGISTSTIDRWRREGKIAVIRVGKQNRFSREQVDAILRGELQYQNQTYFGKSM